MVAGLLAYAVLLTACGTSVANADTTLPTPNKESAVVQDPAAPLPGATITLTGTRLTRGNAVDCPQLRDDAGVVHTLSYLSPGVAIGARVTVSGVYGIMTTCLGTVLVVAQEQLLEK